MLDWPQRAPNVTGPSPHSHFHLTSWSGVPTNLWLWAPSSCAIKKGGSWWAQSWLWPNLRSDILVRPITKAQQRWEDSTLSLFTPPPPRRPRLSRRSSTLSRRPTDLLLHHQQIPLRQFLRCRVLRTSPPVKHTNPKTISIIFIMFRPTRCNHIQSLAIVWLSSLTIYTTNKPEWARYNTTGGPSMRRLEELQAKSPTWVCFICSWKKSWVCSIRSGKKKLEVRSSVHCSYIPWHATTAELR
jgi:hypothetical protein